jgi:hypothetical protein
MSRPLFLGLLSLYFLFIGYEVLSSDYLFTDEAYRLWHNVDRNGVFNDFHTQGRTLGGIMVRWLFARAHTVRDIRWIRLLSLVECVLLTIGLFAALRRWQRTIPALSDAHVYLIVAIVAASLPFTNWIGWGVSVIIPMSALLSLGAGVLLYEGMQGTAMGGRIFRMVIALVLGVVALFFYQSPFPLLLLPFYLRFLTRRDGRIDGEERWAIGFFLLVMGVYYVLFRLGLRWTHFEASVRTNLATDPLERVSFFISTPMNQAFNGNFSYDARSVLSQAVFPVLLLSWLIWLFRSMRREGKGVAVVARWAGIVLAFWVMAFLPQLAGHEAFAPYRTMLVLTLFVSLALADSLLTAGPVRNRKAAYGWALVLLLLVRGAYNYATYIAGPLQGEYRIVREVVQKEYRTGTRRVAFVRAAADGFRPFYGIGSYTDEFGLPSTNKDWTPEPLVKQLVYEITGRRDSAEALQVSLFTTSQAARDSFPGQDPRVVVIDMPRLLE